MMENRAYEDEQNKLAQYQQHPHNFAQDEEVEPRVLETCHQDHQFHPRYGVMEQHITECHVYEDIVTPYGTSGFHRNLTLPLRRASKSCESIEGNPTSSSVRVTNRERTRGSVIDRLTRDDRIRDGSRDDNSVSSMERPQRRRRKKDCKHCKNKTPTREDEIRQHHHHHHHHQLQRDQFPVYGERGAELRAIFGLPDLNFCRLAPNCLAPGVVYAIGCNGTDCNNSMVHIPQTASTMVIKPTGGDGPVPRFGQENNPTDDKTLITSAKGPGRAAGMKVNSIYAQEHWHAKDPRIFLNDPKDQNSPFQRAYSAVSANSPSSENRANLRRSVRDEPAPHPARLRKHRHGWTLHFGRPLTGTTCTKSLILLLIVVLALLGIGGIALYIVFEPEKLHVIQQYLRSSARNSSTSKNGTYAQEFEEPIISSTPSLLEALLNATVSPIGSGGVDDSEPIFVTTLTTIARRTPSTTTSTSTPTTISTTTTTTTTMTTREFLESHSRWRRPCPDCHGDEVCVARNADETPFCQPAIDLTDPTGCAGLCDDRTQKCHKVETGGYRCAEIEHHCLDDEWTCLNIFCIPLVKRCDGQMNCYDHSDEYDCECNLKTHFHCGNQTSCLPLSKKCDGHVDCFDATDEENCTTSHDLGRLCPSEDDFTCRNKQQCIRKKRYCDRIPDCKDGSDEPHGCQGRCNKHEFTCNNGRCIDKADKCNRIDDCGDHSDEQHCRERL